MTTHHHDPAPPTVSRVTAGLAALACVACCALPFLIAAGLLTGAGAALAQNLLLAAAAGLVTVAGLLWWRQHRRAVRQASANGCGNGTCAC